MSKRLGRKAQKPKSSGVIRYPVCSCPVANYSFPRGRGMNLNKKELRTRAHSFAVHSVLYPLDVACINMPSSRWWPGSPRSLFLVGETLCPVTWQDNDTTWMLGKTLGNHLIITTATPRGHAISCAQMALTWSTCDHTKQIFFILITNESAEILRCEYICNV